MLHLTTPAPHIPFALRGGVLARPRTASTRLRADPFRLARTAAFRPRAVPFRVNITAYCNHPAISFAAFRPRAVPFRVNITAYCNHPAISFRLARNTLSCVPKPAPRQVLRRCALDSSACALCTYSVAVAPRARRTRIRVRRERQVGNLKLINPALRAFGTGNACVGPAAAQEERAAGARRARHTRPCGRSAATLSPVAGQTGFAGHALAGRYVRAAALQELAHLALSRCLLGARPAVPRARMRGLGQRLHRSPPVRPRPQATRRHACGQHRGGACGESQRHPPPPLPAAAAAAAARKRLVEHECALHHAGIG